MNEMPLQKILDFQPVIYCVIDREQRFSYVNKTTADILGYNLQELKGAPFLSFVVEQDRDRTTHIFRQLQQGRFIERFENKYYHKNGTIITLRWTSQWDTQAQVLFGVGHPITQDDRVSKLQQAFAQKLKQNNSKLSETFDQITDGFYTLDEQWRFIYVNRAAERILQLKKEALLAQVLWDIFPEVKDTIIEQEYKRCFEQQTQVRFEAYYAHPLHKWLEVSAHPSSAGISVILRDISERKKSEEEMHKFSLIVKHTDNLVTLCDIAGRIKWVNEAFVKKTGYSLPEVQGKRADDVLCGPETDTQAIERARAQYKKGEPLNEILLYYTKRKEKLWVHKTGQVIYDGAGKPKELFSIQTDITERKLLEEQLVQEREARQREETAAVIQMQEQERSAIGHELHDNVNQLLTTVKLYLEMSLTTKEGKEQLTKKAIQLVQHSISEIRHLSKQLSAPTIGEITLTESIKDLCDSIEMANQFTITLNTPGIEELEVRQEVHLAIYRILQEHLTNILKHADAQHVHITLHFTDNTITLLVTDDGKGFDPHQKRSGIGINNMKSRAVSINGKLIINSRPGKGCTLQAHFPL